MVKKFRAKIVTNTKKKKPNKPMPHRSKFTQRLIEKQAKLALESVWIADGKCLEGITHTGIYDRHYPVPQGMVPGQWQLAVADEVTNMVASAPVEWSVWYGTFETDGKKEWVTGHIKSFPPKASNELGDDVHSLLEKLRDSRNDKHVVSWGWLATPKKNVDLDFSEAAIIEKFRAWGAFNKEFCNLVNAERAMKEREKAGEKIA